MRSVASLWFSWTVAKSTGHCTFSNDEKFSAAPGWNAASPSSSAQDGYSNRAALTPLHLPSSIKII